jgi:hypothetical protein
MTDQDPDLKDIAKLTARQLLRLPTPALTRLLRQAIDETRKAKRREHWLRAIRAMKVRMEGNPPWGDE